jgi:signal transduction histidine kinase
VASRDPAAPAPLRDGLIRWLLAVGPVVVLGLLTIALAGRDWRDAGLPTLLLVVLPLGVRSPLPIPAFVIVGAGAIVTAASFQIPWVQILAVVLASFEVGHRSADRTSSLAAIVLVAAGMTLGFLLQDVDPVEATVLPFVFLVPSWLAGDTIRARRIEMARRIEDAERGLRDREEQLRAAADEERRHVARELHDVVAHAVSVMVVQAGAARQVLRSSPESAEQALLAVESAGRDAMSDLRRFLGSIDPGDDAGGVAPQPGVESLPTLVERVREAGLPATIEVDGEPRVLPASLEVTVYRIVQEALTNALRHAGRAATVARLIWEPDGLRVEVLDDGPTASAPPAGGSGRGLIGMRDRVALAGGSLEVGPRLGGGFAVRARLPLPELSAAVAGASPGPSSLEGPADPEPRAR